MGFIHYVKIRKGVSNDTRETRVINCLTTIGTKM